MKKALSIFLVMITLIISFTGCQTQSKPSEHDNEDSFQPEPDSLINENAESAHFDEFQLSIFSYDEYVKFTKTAKLPEYFVTYEDISEFGEFSGFVCLSKSEHGDYSSLFYTFVDETGTEFSMYVDYIPLRNSTAEKTERPIINEANINASDMRTAKVTEFSTYSYNNIEYTYYASGKLHSIVWRRGDIQYKLHENLITYPITNKSTAISKMLKLESASQVASTVKSYPNET
jgi:hypothetical protein